MVSPLQTDHNTASYRGEGGGISQEILTKKLKVKLEYTTQRVVIGDHTLNISDHIVIGEGRVVKGGLTAW